MTSPDASDERSMPPVSWILSGALGFVVTGGILLSSYAPRVAPMMWPTVLLIVAWVLLVTAVVVLVRIRNFAWRTFAKVFRWALLAYLIVAGMIEFAFVRNHTRGTSLLEVSLMLVVFATSVPINIAFTTARYAES